MKIGAETRYLLTFSRMLRHAQKFPLKREEELQRLGVTLKLG
jgi:hypothetical protein